MKFSLPVVLALAMLLVLPSCKRRKGDAGPDKVALPLDQAPRASQPTLTAADAQASAEVLNAYVKQWNTLMKRPLNNLDELIASKILPSLPPAPPGRQFKLDVAAQKVSLVEAGQ